MPTRCLKGILLSFILLLIFTNGSSAIKFPDHLPATVDWDIRETVSAYSERLQAAKNTEQVQTVISDILERIGVGVYDVYGTPIRIGNESSEDGFYFYDFEIKFIADAFLERQYMPLHAIVSSWQSMQIPIIPIGESQTQIVSTAAVEKAMRAMRAVAEAQPEHPGGFLIVLVDTLGDREEYPFSLLEEETGPSGFLATMDSMLAEQLQEMHQEAIVDGDREMAARIETVNTESGRAALIEKMGTGDMFGMMQLFLGDQLLAEIEAELREAQREADAETPPAMRQMLRSMGLFFSGADIDIVDVGLQSSRQITEEFLDNWQAEMREISRDVRRQYQLAMEVPATEYANHIYSVEESLVDVVFAYANTEQETESVTEQVEFLEQEYREAEQIREEYERRFGPPSFADEGMSDIYLDPIQSLLVHIDMFMEPRPQPVSKLSPVDIFAGWSGWIRPTAQAQTSCYIGGIGGEFADGFGWLGQTLSTAAQIKSAYQNLISYKAAAKSVVRGAVQTAATEISVEVIYHVDDKEIRGWPQNPNGSIHLRHGEERDQHKIQVLVKIESPFLDALSDVLADVDPLRACAPIRDLLDVAGGVDPMRELDDLADTDLSVPVRFQPSPDYFTEYLLPYKPSSWDAVRGLTFTKNTDDKGEASGFFYVKKCEPDIGGLRTIKRDLMQVQALVNASPAAMYNPARWGLAVGEEIFRPVSAEVPIQVSVHEPVRRFGSLTMERAVHVSAEIFRQDENGLSALDVDGYVTLNVYTTDMRMDKQGFIEADYRALVSGSITISDHYDRIKSCDECEECWEGQTLSTVTEIDGSVSGSTSAIIFDVNSRADLYVLWPGPLLVEIVNAIDSWGGAITGTKYTWSCDEDDTEPVIEIVHHIQQLGNIANYLFDPTRPSQRHYVKFDRGYQLQDRTSAIRSLPIISIHQAFGTPIPDLRYTIITNIAWNLRDEATEHGPRD